MSTLTLKCIFSGLLYTGGDSLPGQVTIVKMSQLS